MSLTFIETVKIQLKTINNGNICRMEETNLSRDEFDSIPPDARRRLLLIVDPTGIRHLLRLDPVGHVDTGLETDESAFNSILQINKRERMIFR